MRPPSLSAYRPMTPVRFGIYSPQAQWRRILHLVKDNRSVSDALTMLAASKPDPITQGQFTEDFKTFLANLNAKPRSEFCESERLKFLKNLDRELARSKEFAVPRSIQQVIMQELYPL